MTDQGSVAHHPSLSEEGASPSVSTSWKTSIVSSYILALAHVRHLGKSHASMVYDHAQRSVVVLGSIVPLIRLQSLFLLPVPLCDLTCSSEHGPKVPPEHTFQASPHPGPGIPPTCVCQLSKLNLARYFAHIAGHGTWSSFGTLYW